MLWLVIPQSAMTVRWYGRLINMAENREDTKELREYLIDFTNGDTPSNLYIVADDIIEIVNRMSKSGPLKYVVDIDISEVQERLEKFQEEMKDTLAKANEISIASDDIELDDYEMKHLHNCDGRKYVSHPMNILVNDTGMIYVLPHSRNTIPFCPYCGRSAKQIREDTNMLDKEIQCTECGSRHNLMYCPSKDFFGGKAYYCPKKGDESKEIARHREDRLVVWNGREFREA